MGLDNRVDPLHMELYIAIGVMNQLRSAYIKYACNGCYPLPYGDSLAKREPLDRVDEFLNKVQVTLNQKTKEPVGDLWD